MGLFDSKVTENEKAYSEGYNAGKENTDTSLDGFADKLASGIYTEREQQLSDIRQSGKDQGTRDRNKLW